MFEYKDMEKAFNESVLPSFGVILPTEGTQRAITLLYFFSNQGKVVTKSEVEIFVCGSLNTPTKDIQDCRHLSKQCGFNILQGGNFFGEYRLKRGEYCFVGFDAPNKYFSIKRRAEDLDFDEIKSKYKYVCATCGSKEGTIHRYSGKVVFLQKGHKNPHLGMDNSNIIPQCDYCNARARNLFVFDDFGFPKYMTIEGLSSIPSEIREEYIKELRRLNV